MTIVACSTTWTTFPILFLTTLALMRPEKHAVCTMNQIRKILRLRSSYLSTTCISFPPAAAADAGYFFPSVDK